MAAPDTSAPDLTEQWLSVGYATVEQACHDLKAAIRAGYVWREDEGFGFKEFGRKWKRRDEPKRKQPVFLNFYTCTAQIKGLVAWFTGGGADEWMELLGSPLSGQDLLNASFRAARRELVKPRRLVWEEIGGTR